MFKQTFDTIDEVTHAAKGEASSATLRGRCRRPTFLLFSRAWRCWEQDQGHLEHGEQIISNGYINGDVSEQLQQKVMQRCSRGTRPACNSTQWRTLGVSWCQERELNIQDVNPWDANHVVHVSCVAGKRQTFPFMCASGKADLSMRMRSIQSPPCPSHRAYFPSA